MKVQPRAGVGVAAFLIYLVVFYGVWIVNGIDYANIGTSADTLLKWYVAPLAAGAVVLAIMTTLLGWWRPALRETRRAPRWTLITPVLMFLTGILVLANKDFSATTTQMWLYLVLGSLGVGFCEELVIRGLLLVGLRGSVRETAVWFLSTLMFGLLHLPNWVFGAGPSAVSQVFIAFLGGTTFYLLRRGSGLLIWAMLLHAFWDFSSFAGRDGGAVGLLAVPIGLISLLVVLVLLRTERDHDADLAPYRRDAEPAAA